MTHDPGSTDALQLVVGSVRFSTADRRTYPSLNPADEGDVVALVPSATSEDVHAAMTAAHVAQGAWAARSTIERGSLLFEAGRLLESRAPAMADLLVREVGKTAGEAAGEVQRGVDVLRYYAGLGSSSNGDVLPSRLQNGFAYTRHEPVGPTVVITPWNFPLAIPLWKMAPALLYGNTVVFKPAEQASSVAWSLVRVLLEAGLPSGVLNVLFGDGALIGATLFASAGPLRAVSFTGSTLVGRQVEREAQSCGLKVQLELGGNNSTIVLADADVEAAARAVTSSAMRYAGQKCTATSRAIVAEPILARFREALLAEVSRLRVGDPARAQDVEVGPLIDRASQQRFVSSVAAAADVPGVQVLIGGHALRNDGLDVGCFVAPAVLEGVAPGSTFDQAELFGPAVSLLPVADLAGAVELANATPYGLSAAVFTRDLASALQCARELEVGVIKINCESTGLEPQVPFGGAKDSGSHYREQGTVARDFFTQVKSVYVQPEA